MAPLPAGRRVGSGAVRAGGGRRAVIGNAGSGTARWWRLAAGTAAALAIAVLGGPDAGATPATGSAGWSPAPAAASSRSAPASGRGAAAGGACTAALGAPLRPVWAPAPGTPPGWLTTGDRTSAAVFRGSDNGAGGVDRRVAGLPGPGPTGPAGPWPDARRPDPAAALRVPGRGPPAGRV